MLASSKLNHRPTPPFHSRECGAGAIKSVFNFSISTEMIFVELRNKILLEHLSNPREHPPQITSLIPRQILPPSRAVGGRGGFQLQDYHRVFRV